MKTILIFILMMSLKISLSVYVSYLQCTHSRYFLNFFSHNERFLLEFEKNKDYITIENLMNYGKALQTHGKVIMIFLDDVMNYNTNIFPFNLMTINLYLNNVTGSLNMIAQNENDEKNDAKNLFEGYKIIHFAVKEQLNIFINRNCNNYSFNYHMVNCNPPIGENEYTTNNLLNVNDGLKNRILTKLRKSVERNSYNNFHPKFILFCDLMTQHRELNQIRFTPLDIQCSNHTRLTLHDIFQYMKYNFNSNDVLRYTKMVIVATFRPIGILIRNFLTLIQVTSSENSDSVTSWLKPTLIKKGKKIISYVIDFILLHIFDFKKKFIINDVLNKFDNILNTYIVKKKMTEIDNIKINTSIKKLSKFFIKNKIYFTSDIVLTNENINENNADQIKNQLEQIMKQVDIYMIDLKKWSDYFNLIRIKFKIRSFSITDHNTFIDYKVKDHICNTKTHFEIYKSGTNDSNKIIIEYFKDVDVVKNDNTEFNLENVKNNSDENNIDRNDSLENQLNFKPRYMIEYWPYNK
ncbi:uncharacterized protein PF13_0277-like [Daktulosphaira vitifoliae]|uniref:uncharacterized protein PF13_0277-like n=1 Tax=Daktulosphaira vitifoliae TaxID=58002 RepID=UPI0021AA8312|nr:uncharacterized protein PF13_0277-like [Daktulosphaira vitifoliae]